MICLGVMILVMLIGILLSLAIIDGRMKRIRENQTATIENLKSIQTSLENIDRIISHVEKMGKW